MRTWVARYLYDSLVHELENLYFRGIRRKLLGGTSGKTCVEIGAGSGLGLESWPSDVARLVLVEPMKEMQEHLLERLHSGKKNGTVSFTVEPEIVSCKLEGKNSLPFADNTFDVLFTSLVFCGIEDQDIACAEVKRVLKPHGEIIFMEHVSAKEGTWVRLLASLTNWMFEIFWKCSAMRDTHLTFEKEFNNAQYDMLVVPFWKTGIDNHIVHGSARNPKKE